MNDELKQQIYLLEDSIKKMKDLLLIKTDGKLYINKKIEDGILDNLHQASDIQLKKLHNYNWRFYNDLNNSDNLKNEIKYRLRLAKIDSLL